MSDSNQFDRVGDKQSRARPGEPGWETAPNTDKTYFDNPYRTDASRIKHPKWRDELGKWRDELDGSVVRTNMDLLRPQRGFEHFRNSRRCRWPPAA